MTFYCCQLILKSCQKLQVRRVKKFAAGTVLDPITVHPEMTIGELLRLTQDNNISGVPVVEKGTDKVIGIVTHRDWRFETNLSLPVSHIMTPKDQLVTVKEGESNENIKKLLH